MSLELNREKGYFDRIWLDWLKNSLANGDNFFGELKSNKICLTDGSGSQHLVCLHGNALSSGYDLVFPETAGEENQLLSTDGLGNLVWKDAASIVKDVDEDTFIDVEATPDNDLILMNAGGNAISTFSSSGFAFHPDTNVTAGAFIIGKTYTISAISDTDFKAIGAADNIVGVSFTATGVGSGSGTAKPAYVLDSAGLNMSMQKITSLKTPEDDYDGANKLYVDEKVQPVSWRAEVKAVATTTVDIATGGELIIDNVKLSSGDRVLLIGQDAGGSSVAHVDNGIYIVDTGAWTRAGDFATGQHAGRACVMAGGGSEDQVQSGSLVVGLSYEILAATVEHASGAFNVGTTYEISVAGTTDFVAEHGAADNNAGTTFTAAVAGTGTGKATTSTDFVAEQGASDNNAGTVFVATAVGTGFGLVKTVNAVYDNIGFICSNLVDEAEIGTDALLFVQFASLDFDAGEALDKSLETFNVLYDNTSIGLNAVNQLELKDVVPAVPTGELPSLLVNSTVEKVARINIDSKGRVVEAAEWHLNKLVHGTSSVSVALDSNVLITAPQVDLTGDLSLLDNELIKLGTNDDLHIFSDGSNSYIREYGNGILQIGTNGAHVSIDDLANSKTLAQFLTGATDSHVKLYYDNELKFRTTDTGTKQQGTQHLFTSQEGANGSMKMILRSNGDDLVQTSHPILEFQDGVTPYSAIWQSDDSFELSNATSNNCMINFRCDNGGVSGTVPTPYLASVVFRLLPDTVEAHQKVLPSVDETLSLGESGQKWSSFFTKDGDFSGEVIMDGLASQVAETSFIYIDGSGSLRNGECNGIADGGTAGDFPLDVTKTIEMNASTKKLQLKPFDATYLTPGTYPTTVYPLAALQYVDMVARFSVDQYGRVWEAEQHYLKFLKHGGATVECISDTGEVSYQVVLTATETQLTGHLELDSTKHITMGTNPITTASGANAIAIGSETLAGATMSGGGVAGAGEMKASGVASIAIGLDAKSTNNSTVSIGTESKSTGNNTIAIGYQAVAEGVSSIAIGQEMTATGQQSIAIGRQSSSTGSQSIAIGKDASCFHDNTIHLNAMGSSGVATNQANSFYVDPIRNDDVTVVAPMFYNTSTKEVVYKSPPASQPTGGIYPTGAGQYVSAVAQVTVEASGLVTLAEEKKLVQIEHGSTSVVCDFNGDIQMNVAAGKNVVIDNVPLNVSPDAATFGGNGTNDNMYYLYIENNTGKVTKRLGLAPLDSSTIGNGNARPALVLNSGKRVVQPYELAGNRSGSGGDDGFLRLSAGGFTNLGSASYIDISGYSNFTDLSKTIVMHTGNAERLRIDNSKVQIANQFFAPNLSTTTDETFKPLKIDTNGQVFVGEVVPTSLIEDGDQDTKVTVENSTDEDIIRFSAAGSELMTIDSFRVTATNTTANSYVYDTSNSGVVNPSAVITTATAGALECKGGLVINSSGAASSEALFVKGRSHFQGDYHRFTGESGENCHVVIGGDPLNGADETKLPGLFLAADGNILQNGIFASSNANSRPGYNMVIAHNGGGAEGAIEFRIGNTTVNNDGTSTNLLTYNDTPTICKVVSAGNAQSTDGGFIPETDNTFDLGSSLRKWKSLHVANMSVTNLQFMDIGHSAVIIYTAGELTYGWPSKMRDRAGESVITMTEYTTGPVETNDGIRFKTTPTGGVITEFMFLKKEGILTLNKEDQNTYTMSTHGSSVTSATAGCAEFKGGVCINTSGATTDNALFVKGGTHFEGPLHRFQGGDGENCHVIIGGDAENNDENLLPGLFFAQDGNIINQGIFPSKNESGTRPGNNLVIAQNSGTNAVNAIEFRVGLSAITQSNSPTGNLLDYSKVPTICKIQTTGFHPDAAASFSLGTTTLRWQNIYANNAVNTSDYRLKKNVNYDFDALAMIDKLKPCSFEWKDSKNGLQDESDHTSTTEYGFLAHELDEVHPLAVSGKKDGKTAATETEPEKDLYQGICQSKLIGILTKAIKELKAQNDALAARVAALEAN